MCAEVRWWTLLRSSLTYWDPQHDQVYVECSAEWVGSPDEKRCVWELFKVPPPPYGYDPGTIWPSPDDASFGLLRLTPWRIELWPAPAEMAEQKPSRVWRPAS
jgi:hypothetical protein